RAKQVEPLYHCATCVSGDCGEQCGSPEGHWWLLGRDRHLHCRRRARRWVYDCSHWERVESLLDAGQDVAPIKPAVATSQCWKRDARDTEFSDAVYQVA